VVESRTFTGTVPVGKGHLVKRWVILGAAILVGFAVTWLLPVSYAADDAQVRLLTGQVTTTSDAPLSEAVVYLKNTRTLSVKTFITDKQGNYRFPALSPNVDYEIYSEYKGHKSDTKTLSSFDSRQHAVINLKINTGK
jgi:hypothetical protein